MVRAIMRATIALILVAILPCAMTFAPGSTLPMPIALRYTVTNKAFGPVMQRMSKTWKGVKEFKANLNAARNAFAVPAGVILSQFLLPVQEAAAKGGEYGFLEGKAVALIHPIAMAGIFLFTLYTGYQGLMWRRIRELGDELKPLQDDLRGMIKEREAAEGEEGESASSPSAAVAALQKQIDELTAQRKELISGNFRDKHFAAASSLLALGVTFSAEGAVETYIRKGQLFPDEHLFAGGGITVLWAVAAALAPAMQKGDQNARNIHVAINGVIIALFAWQIPTGWEILANQDWGIWVKTPW